MADVPSPTSESLRALERQLAQGEGAESAALVPAGVSPTYAALTALLRPGDHLVASAWSHGDTTARLSQQLGALGIAVTLVDPSALRAWRSALQKSTRAIFIEAPVGPTDRTIVLRPASYVTKELGLALVVDRTFATVDARAFEAGADVVVRSSPSLLAGHDEYAGVICGTTSYVDEVRRRLRAPPPSQSAPNVQTT